MTQETTESIQIVVNGEFRKVPANLTLSEILAFLEIDPSRIAVELNRSIVSRANWGKITIDRGAALEIVQFVGGG